MSACLLSLSVISLLLPVRHLVLTLLHTLNDRLWDDWINVTFG